MNYKELISDIKELQKGVYTPLEYVIYNKVDGYLDLIKLIKE